MSLELAEETIKHLGNEDALVLKRIIDNFDYQKHEMDDLMGLCLVMLNELEEEE
jgi:hypothetical protein